MWRVLMESAAVIESPQLTHWRSSDCCVRYEIEVVVMDEDLGEDDLIGKTTINLLPYFRHGFIDEWIKIFDPAKDWGDRDDMGEIRLIIDFKGPPGVRYVRGGIRCSAFDLARRRPPGYGSRTAFDDTCIQVPTAPRFG